MKTINTILAVLLLSLSVNTFAGDKDKKASRLEKKFDSELRLEKWMTELKEFSRGIIVNYDEALVMEKWMTEEFEVNTIDKELNLENWMMEDFDLAADKELELEDWMTKTF